MLMLIKVPRGSIEEEMAAVCRELETQPSPVYIPRLFLKLGLESMRIAEKTFNLDCGPAAGSETAFTVRSEVSENERAIADWPDMRSAIYTTVCACARQHEVNFSEESFDAMMPDVAAFLQRELADINLSLLIKSFYASIGATAIMSPDAIKKLITKNSREPELEKFSVWVIQHEKIANFRAYEVIAEYLQAYRRGIAELKKTRGRIAHCPG